MAKELPYFKFYPGEWLKGDITICSIEAQGLFINICVYYWMRDCNMSLTNVQQRFNKYETELNELEREELINIDKDDNIIIKFLDEQMSEFAEISKKRSDAGKASAEKRRGNKCSTSVQQKPNNKEKIREDKEEDKDNKNIPAFQEFLDYAKEKEPRLLDNSVRLKYDAWIENKWKDGNNRKILNWKTKLINTIPYLEKDTKYRNNPDQIFDDKI